MKPRKLKEELISLFDANGKYLGDYSLIELNQFRVDAKAANFDITGYTVITSSSNNEYVFNKYRLRYVNVTDMDILTVLDAQLEYILGDVSKEALDKYINKIKI